ncbi:MAG: glycosyltransferase 87 family protein [Thermoleophilia bacterium]
MTRRAGALAAGAAVCLLIVAAAVVRIRAADGVTLGDIPTYEHAARLMRLGALPYRDFDVEYPPGAALLFWAADLLPGRYEIAFQALMSACACAAAAGIVATGRALDLPLWRVTAGAALVPASVWMLGDLSLPRYDLAVTALLAWLVWCAVTGRWRAAWLLMAAAVLMKLVPAALAPALLVAHLHAVPPRRAARDLAPAVAAGLAVVVPAALAAPAGLWRSVAYHLERPLQIESTGSALLLAAHHIGGLPVRVVRTYGSDNLEGGLPQALATAGSLLGVALAALLAVLLHRRLRAADGADPRYLASVLAATLLVLIATGKVLSPQYLLWLPAVVALLPGRRGIAVLPLMLAVLWLSHRVFPVGYLGLVEELDPRTVILLCARDVLLVVLAAVSWPRVSRADKGNAHAPGPFPAR